MKWSDGSIESDLPMQRLAELFNINHFIVSQGSLLSPCSRAQAAAPFIISFLNSVYCHVVLWTETNRWLDNVSKCENVCAPAQHQQLHAALAYYYFFFPSSSVSYIYAVNPHVVPFLMEKWEDPWGIVRTLKYIVISELEHRCKQARLFPPVLYRNSTSSSTPPHLFFPIGEYFYLYLSSWRISG
jgi:hypothetical protein